MFLYSSIIRRWLHGTGTCLAYHATHEFGGDVTALPSGDVWLKEINETPQSRRHLAIHDQHLVDLNDADALAWAAGSWKAIPQNRSHRHGDRHRPAGQRLRRPRHRRSVLDPNGETSREMAFDRKSRKPAGLPMPLPALRDDLRSPEPPSGPPRQIRVQHRRIAFGKYLSGDLEVPDAV